MTTGAATVHVARTATTNDAGGVHAALFRLVQEVTGGTPGSEGATLRLSHACPRCGSSDHGRPLVRCAPHSADTTSHASHTTRAGMVPAHVSVARASSGGIAALAVCVEHPVGIDTELADDTTLARVADPAFRTLAGHNEGEDAGSMTGPMSTERDESAKDLLRNWVRTEAVLKARGTGLSAEASELRWRRLGGAARRVTSGPPARLVDVDLGLAEDIPLLTAVAVAADVPVRIVRHELA